MRHRSIAVGLPALLLLVAPWSLAAQVGTDAPLGPAIRIDGPPAPLAPATITRDDRGNATVRAVRLTESIRLDGRLDEEMYSRVPALTGFLQTLPDEGAPATENTEAWIWFDDENVYVSAKLYDSAPESEWVANEMRRDTNQLRNNDTFSVSFDTYYDHRNALFFYTNPLGARADIQHTNEGNPNGDWNPIWDVRTGRFEGGWTVEMQFPFKSLRYRPGREQVWGVQLRRAIRRKNEWVHLTQIPRTAVNGNSGASAVMRVSRHATLVGIQAPDAGRNIELKPYVISGLETDRGASPAISNDASADAGLDVKLGITENLTADLTINTDFAQVEADEQQVNLTRFELSFPEKREFFLEGRDIYQFALGAGGGDTPTLFFSRRIGLQDGDLVPIRAGGRVTGKLGPFDVGAMNLQTGGDDALGIESTNFTVLRLRRDVFARSTIGALFTGRSQSTVADGSNQTFGVDGNFAFRQDLNFAGYFAQTRTSGLTTDDRSYLGSFNYNGDLFGGGLSYLRVGENFNPEVGFLRRTAFRETVASARISPRPRSLESVRRLNLALSMDYLEHDAERRYVESREASARFQIEYQSSDVIDFSFVNAYEYLDRSFRISGGGGVAVPAGRYSFNDFGVGLGLGLQRWYSGSLAFHRGSFYTGDKTTVALRTGRINVSTRLSLEPTLSFNWIDLPQGSFRTDLAVTRVNYAFSPRMFFGGLVQYNSGNHSVSSNLRLRLEYRPGSELFIVYTEARNTDLLDRFSELANRGLTVKLNYLLRR